MQSSFSDDSLKLRLSKPPKLASLSHTVASLFSHKSSSTTPDHSPLTTPTSSPEVYPAEEGLFCGVHLPMIHSFSLKSVPPPLTPLEVDSSMFELYPMARSSHSYGLNMFRISNVLEKQNSSEGKLSDLVV